MNPQISLNIYSEDFTQPLGTLELTDHADFPLALTWSTGDFTDITKRSGSFSKTFKVPASKLNNRLLEYIYQIGINFYQKHASCRAEVLYNGIPFFSGKLKINNVSQHNRPAEYDLELIGDNLDWIEYMKDHTIRDIDYGNRTATYYYDELSEGFGYNPLQVAATIKLHPYTEAYALASWANFPDKFDFVYGLKSYGAWKSGNKVVMEDLRPDVSIAHIFREAFSKAGYALESDFCESGFFKKLVLAFTGDGFTKAANANDAMLFKSVLCQPKVFANLPKNSTIGPSLLPLSDCAGFFDNGNNYNTQVYTVPSSSMQQFVIAASIKITNWHQNLKYLGIGVGRLVGGNLVSIAEEAVAFTNNGQTVNVTVDTQFLPFAQGEQICVYTIVKTHNWGLSNFNLQNKSPRFEIQQLEFYNAITGDIVEGATYEVSQVLPDVKLIDVLTGIMNMFNLYFRTDTVTKKVYCEPRDQFLKPLSEAHDWTAKFDLSREAGIQYIDDYKRDVTFQYKLDTKDAFLKERAETTKKQPGSLAHKLPIKYNPGNQELGTKNFAYTLTFQDWNIFNPFNQSNAAPEIPRLWKDLAPYPDVNYDFAPRVLYYEGYKAKTLPNRLGQPKTSAWLFGRNPSFRLKYPVLSSDVLAYGGVQGLVNNYYKNTIAQIEDGRQVIAYFKLDLTDVLQLNLQRPIYINHPTIRGYYYITTIADYRPALGLPVKVTLLPVLATNPVELDLTSQAEYTSVSQMAPTLGRGIGRASQYGNEHLGSLTDTPSAVLHNGTGNWAPAGTASVALGQGAVATARNQTVLGAYNVVSPDDIIQVGGGTSNTDRYRAFTFTQDGNFLVQGGYLYTTDGREIMFASQRNEQGLVKRFDKLHLKGNQ
jgi:hypothetical protein